MTSLLNSPLDLMLSLLTSSTLPGTGWAAAWHQVMWTSGPMLVWLLNLAAGAENLWTCPAVTSQHGGYSPRVFWSPLQSWVCLQLHHHYFMNYFSGLQCKSWAEFSSGSCCNERSVMAEIGDRMNQSLRGNFYLVTDEEQTFQLPQHLSTQCDITKQK